MKLHLIGTRVAASARETTAGAYQNQRGSGPRSRGSGGLSRERGRTSWSFGAAPAAEIPTAQDLALLHPLHACSSGLTPVDALAEAGFLRLGDELRRGDHQRRRRRRDAAAGSREAPPACASRRKTPPSSI